MRTLETLLIEVFKAQGANNAEILAKRAADAIDLNKRDQRIYMLRTVKGMTESEVGAIVGLQIRHVRRIYSEQKLLNALK